MNKTTRTMIAAAAVAGILTGMTVKTANAGVLANSVLAEEKSTCSGKDGCKGKKEKGSCSGKDGCKGKKEGEKEKASCSGKDGCPGKKDK
jgi:hypothetical protein